MKQFIFLCLSIIIVCTVTAQAITIDTSKATVSFHFIDDDVDGTFSELQFTGNINLDSLQNSTLSGTVQTKTIDTNNWLRSRHLRTKKYFNARDFPQIKFNSTTITGSNKNFTVKGTLTIKGIEKNGTWEFVNNGQNLTGTTTFNTHDFNVSIHSARERNKVNVTILLPYQ